MPALEAIYQHPLITKEQFAEIFAAHQLTHLSKGDFLLKENKMANEYYVLEAGVVRSFVIDYTGNDITINFFVEGDIVIEVSSLFQRIITKENIQALTDCTCWKITFDDFQKLYHSIPGFSEWGRAWMSKNMFRLKQRSVEMFTDSATQRYKKLLDEKPQVLQYAPLKYIATYLGITDTSLSRIRKEMNK